MASYCRFWKPRRPKKLPWLNTTMIGQLISFQDMLGLLGRPDVGIVVIQGVGGSGKTWAATAAYKAARNSSYFDEYIWVSLSKECSIRRCMHKIAASLPCCNTDNSTVENTKTTIKEYLTTRKFLLVLDNAYFIEDGILEYLGIPHPQQQRLGSKIFVTTRTTRTECVMEPNILLTPQPLTYEEPYDLLHEKIGKDISFEHDLVRYCYGMPLIIILLAGILSNAPTQEAFSELVANVHVVLKHQLSVFHTMERIVKFGYRQLPSDNARRCLLYCLLFPDDVGISVKELIWHWVMDGLFQEATCFDEANCTGKKIFDVLAKHGMVYLDHNDRVRVHDVIREAVSSFEMVDKAYVDQQGRFIVGPRYSGRVSLMYTEREYLHRSPRFTHISSLLLRGNYLLKDIPQDLFCHMETLEMLDLSFTRIEVLPCSISCLTKLRMLLLIGCGHLKELRHIAPLVGLEVLDASGCSFLQIIEFGSFDCMVFLKILDLSATSITFLMTSIPASMELQHLNLQGCPFEGSELPYGVSQSGVLQNIPLGSIEDLADWMSMLWLPCGLTFQLSQRFGKQVSIDIDGNSKTYIYASDVHFFKCLKKDSPLWFNCFQKFHIIISPLTDDQTMDNTDSQVPKTNSYFRTKHFPHSIDPERYLEISATVGVPLDLDGILYHAKVISLKRLIMKNPFSDLSIRSMRAVRELWIQNCQELVSLLTPDEVQELSAVGSLNMLWISNMEKLSFFCQGVEDVTSFDCIKNLFLDFCPNLTCLFPSVLRIPYLETLHIRFCDILESVIGTSALGEENLPRLQSLKLWELPEITSICGGVLPSLKKLEVRGCAKLWKIPVGVNENSPFVTVIGEKLWWDNLTWDDGSIKRWVLFRNYGPLLPHLATEG